MMIDSDRMRDVVGDDKDLVSDLACLFVQLLPDVEARLRVSVGDRDGEGVRIAAHQLKNRLRYFGADGLVDRSRKIETAAAAGTYDGLTDEVDRLLVDVEVMLEELRTIVNLPLRRDED